MRFEVELFISCPNSILERSKQFIKQGFWLSDIGTGNVCPRLSLVRNCIDRYKDPMQQMSGGIKASGVRFIYLLCICNRNSVRIEVVYRPIPTINHGISAG